MDPLGDAGDPRPLTLEPIGVVRSPFLDRLDAPRQAGLSEGVEATIELFPRSGLSHALEDLESFRHIWVIYWFHRNRGWRPKVLPPRSQERRGVFATRSPHRPNPLGLSAVELLGIEGQTLRIKNPDMLDGTPVLDLKPYLAYSDSIPDASSGWLESARAPRDPVPSYEVFFSDLAQEELAFLAGAGEALKDRLESILRLGPQPHAYRRIRLSGDRGVLAHKAWRAVFEVRGARIVVEEVFSGYRPSELFGSTSAGLDLHRRFTERFARSALSARRER